MNTEQMAYELAGATTMIAKLSADPTIIRYDKLKAHAAELGLKMEVEGNYFVIRNANREFLHASQTTGELDDYFKEVFGKGVL